jgi:hypothetical protein
MRSLGMKSCENRAENRRVEAEQRHFFEKRAFSKQLDLVVDEI